MRENQARLYRWIDGNALDPRSKAPSSPRRRIHCAPAFPPHRMRPGDLFMATIDLRRLDTNRVGTSPIANGSDITWGEILTAVGSGQSLDKVLRDLYDQGLVKFTFTDGTVAQDVAGNPYRSLSSQSYS